MGLFWGLYGTLERNNNMKHDESKYIVTSNQAIASMIRELTGNRYYHWTNPDTGEKCYTIIKTEDTLAILQVLYNLEQKYKD